MDNVLNIKKPTFIVNSDIVYNNVQQLKKSLPANVLLRPHFKTHDNIEIGNLMKAMGIEKITVSSFEMAEKFANIGFSDITIAFPVNFNEFDSILKLAKSINLNIIISSIEAATLLSQRNIYCRLGYFVEVDTGYHRSGILWDDKNEIQKTLEVLSQISNLKFRGFLTHNGLTYSAKNREEVIKYTVSSNKIMKDLKKEFKYFNPIISVGDTPGCLSMKDFSEINEIRPGNFVYFDLMQLKLGICQLPDIAVRIICPVVDINRMRNEIVIYGGAVHFSKEYLIIDGQTVYGKATKIHGEKIYQISSYLTALSQEHGILRIDNQSINQIKPGDKIEIIPVHSCLTANLMKKNTLVF